ncbi:serine threonine phosphatase 2b catalytic subunit protein [Rutstroemia sp. NJR-2017a WRK4]|nr:serine threonine phosphatase 2b catalytic subunit protein [Rutstroemia sp. NJR-2017a WRK4]
MPPRIPRASVGWAKPFRKSIISDSKHICPIRPRQRHFTSSPTVADAAPAADTNLDRHALSEALLEIQKNAASFVNISRLQLALRGLEQTEGDETIRIAILGLADGGASLKQAKELLRLVLADPLKEEEEWERSLTRSDDIGKPLLVRVGGNEGEVVEQSGRLVHELNVVSPMFHGHKLEILILEMDPPTEDATHSFEEAVLVPTIEIPTSSSGRYTPVTTPVHRTFILGQGVRGAASLLSYPLNANSETVGGAVNLRLPNGESLPIQTIDIATGKEALSTFRKSVDNAISYERQWFSSGIPQIIDWMKSGTSMTQGTTKEPVLRLIQSVIQNANNNLDAERSRQLAQVLSTKASPTEIIALQKTLTTWAERAHTELRDQLDIAFGGHKWRKLGWWKLFWRVDDVSMLTSDILARKFLTEAEEEIIFLAGRIEESGVHGVGAPPPQTLKTRDDAPKPVEEPSSGVPPPNLRDLIVVESDDDLPEKIKPRPWPLHIPITRAFLSDTTVPALQALAQKLVLQTLSTSSVSSALAGLMYASSLSTTLYEAGAVAALGIVWSMRRMQNKWETARKYWEGEVREEGRKAVRNIETIVGENLKEAEMNRGLDPAAEQELERARVAIKAAEAIIR